MAAAPATATRGPGNHPQGVVTDPFGPAVIDTAYLRGMGYGEPGTGKSRVLCSFPKEKGKVLLLAFDPHAPDSILAEHQDNVIVRRIPLDPMIPPSKQDIRRPDLALFAATMTNWKEVYPEVGLVILDTLSFAAQNLLQYYANAKTGVRDHTSLATPAGIVQRPADADYGDAQNQLQAALHFIYDKPYHYFLVCHAGTYEERSGDVVTVKGGPATVGRKLTGTLAGKFTPLLYFARRTQGQRTTYKVHTEHTGIWQAKVASPHGANPAPAIEVPADDPGIVWRTYFEQFTIGGK